MNFSIRPYQSNDVRGVLSVLAESMTADAISEGKFVRQVLLDHNFRAEGAPVAVLNDRIAGFCLAVARHVPLENAPPDADRGYITLLGVAAEFRRHGIGTALLKAAENYLRSQHRTLVMVSSYAPGYFIPGVDVRSYEAGLAFFASCAYEEIYRPISMQIDLWSLATPQRVRDRREQLLREGVTVEPWRAELTLPVIEFAEREFQGDWVRVYRETMSRIAQGEASPSRVIIAHISGQVIGFSHYDAERFGPIGVTVADQGRGIGKVLMYETLHAQRAAGYKTAWFLWSDDKTAARLYTAAGFREVRRFALLRKVL